MLAHCREVISIQLIMPPALCVQLPVRAWNQFWDLGRREWLWGAKGWVCWVAAAAGRCGAVVHTHISHWAEWSNLPYAASSDTKVCPSYQQSGKWLPSLSDRC